jgi:hypothetical protein
MVATKEALTLEEIEAQTALELPPRETPQTVVITCLAVCVGQITIRDVDVRVAAQICAQVEAIRVNGVSIFSCEIRQ